MLFLIALATFCATLFGGLFAIYFKDRLHLILGFSAGAVIGVAFFDLLPEAINLASQTYSVATITAITALGFVIFMMLDRSLFFHSHHQPADHHDHNHEDSKERGLLGASSLSLHSFLDGLAIGLAFQVSAAVGLVVTVAVLTHDFSDGINTVSLIIKNGGSKMLALKLLCADALAPVLGIIVAQFFTMPSQTLGLLLALFAGFFVYLGASDLLPESHHNHPTAYTTLMTVLGVLTMFVAISLAGI